VRIPIKTLIDAYLWWTTANALYVTPPQAFEHACRPLGEAICKHIIHGALLASQRPIVGSNTRAGAWQAHLLMDACRWPRVGFGPMLRARVQVIDATSGVSGLSIVSVSLQARDETAAAKISADQIAGQTAIAIGRTGHERARVDTQPGQNLKK
jgi:hypothetical protein